MPSLTKPSKPGPIHFPMRVNTTKCQAFSRTRVIHTPHGIRKEVIVFNHDFYDYNDHKSIALFVERKSGK